MSGYLLASLFKILEAYLKDIPGKDHVKKSNRFALWK